MPLVPPFMMVIGSISLAIHLSVGYEEVKLGTMVLVLTSLAIVFTVSYLCLLRKVLISKYSHKLIITSLLSILILSGQRIRVQVVSTKEQFSVRRFTYGGDRNYNVQCKIFLAYSLLVVLFLGLPSSSYIEARMSENPRLYQTKKFLATRLSFLPNIDIPTKFEQVRNSPSFIRSVAIMPIVYIILASQIRATPMNKEGTLSIDLAYNANK